MTSTERQRLARRLAKRWSETEQSASITIDAFLSTLVSAESVEDLLHMMYPNRGRVS